MPKSFLPDINPTRWFGLVAQGGSDANAHADAEKIVFFRFETARESFRHSGEDRRRSWPWQSSWHRSQRTNSHPKTNCEAEIEVFASRGAQVAFAVSDTVEAS